MQRSIFSQSFAPGQSGGFPPSLLRLGRFSLCLGLSSFAAVPESAAQAVEAGPGTYWRQAHGLRHWEMDLDHDGDGFTARQEYYIGTDPFEWNPPLRLDWNLQAPGLLLQYPSVLGARYEWERFNQETFQFEYFLGPLKGDGFPLELAVATEEERDFYRLGVVEPDDVDGDKLSSIEEAMLGTDPFDADSDDDTIPDGEEVCFLFSDPLQPVATSATIRGTLYSDPNNDGDLADGEPIAGATIYLDTNYNGRHDAEERSETTAADGSYEFQFVAPGLYQVRQTLPAPNIQTFPQEGVAPVYDMLPDEIVEYVHAEGVGNFDEPYGENASDWPGNWREIEILSQTAEPVPLDLVLKPIGVRYLAPVVQSFYGSEWLSMPEGSTITLRFDEPIVDGPGPDFLFYLVTNQGSGAFDGFELFGGPPVEELAPMGSAFERDAVAAVDLADFGLKGPIHFIKAVAFGNSGGWKGPEFTGIEVLNVAPPDPGAHIVHVISDRVFAERDFGRHFQDFPPRVILQAADNEPSTPELREGESAVVSINAFDDLGLASVELSVNGAPTALAADNTAIVSLPRAGLVRLMARATDSNGQTTDAESLLYVFGPDGALSFDLNLAGPSSSSGVGAPSVRIISPKAGHNGDTDVPIVADIVSDPEPTEWRVEYARVDLVDPYDTAGDDPDYITLATGSGEVFSSPVATLPLSTLPDGIYFVRVCAANNPLLRACQGQVIAKNVPEEELRPQITIDSPVAGSEATMTIDITGTITSSQPLREWFAEYAPADQIDLNNLGAPNDAWKRFAEGAETIDSSALIANFDTTMVENNSYVIRIVAWNEIGLGWIEPLSINVCGEAKLGRNRLEFTDISIDLAGFPLTFTRVYDSLQAGQDGELGFGWAMNLHDADIRETVPDGGPGGLFGSRPFKDGTRVYVTAPSGERLGFTFRPQAATASLFGTVYRGTFEADPGNYHRLELPEGDLPFLSVTADGSVLLYFFNTPYNPDRYVLITPDHQRYTYSEQDGFLRAEDLNGNQLTLTEEGLEHSAGLKLRFTRDARGRITHVSTPDDETWSYAYDAAGNLSTVTDRDGNTTTFHYLEEPAHYLASIEDPLGRMPVRYEYDEDGRLAATIDEEGQRAEVNWDPQGFTGTITDRRGFTTTIEYDARGNVIREIDPLNNITRYEYNDTRNPDKETLMIDANGKEWRYEYNERGDLVTWKPPLHRGIGARMVIAYDDLGNPTSIQRPGYTANQHDDYEWDDEGNLVVANPLRSVKFAVGDYTDEGLPTRVAFPDGYEQRFSYDPKGAVSSIEDNHDLSQQVSIGTNGIDQSFATTTGDRFSVQQTSDTTIAQTDPAGNSIRYVDNRDGTFTVTDRSNQSATVALDSQGRFTEASLPNGGSLAVTYDPNGNRKTLTDPNGNTTTFTYDELNRSNGYVDPLGNVHSVLYDAVGNVSQIIDRNGKKRSFAYNDDRQLLHEYWHDDQDEIFRTISFEYDSSSNLRKVIDTDGEVVHTHTMPRAEDERPDFVTVAYHGQRSYRIDFRWAYGQGQTDAPSRVWINVGTFEKYGYDATYHGGLPHKLTFSHPGSGERNVVRIHRNADRAISRIERTSHLAGQPSNELFTTEYEYDSLGRIESIRHANPDGTLIHPDSELVYGRDVESRITSITTPTQTSTYTYDVMGQLTGADHSDPDRPDEYYTYDLGGNRLTSHLQPAMATIEAPNRVTAAGDFTYTYDAAGNMTTRTNSVTGEVTRFSYDHRNRMVLGTVHPSATEPAATTVRLQYDYRDRLICREIDGEKTWILYDREMPLAEFVDGETAPNAMFFYSPERLDAFQMTWQEEIGQHWLAKDNLESVRGLVENSDTDTEWLTYDSYGRESGTPAHVTKRIPQFAGRTILAPVGVYENRRRYYDPTLGRFLQEDPAGFSGIDYHLMRYAYNRPLFVRDPTGEVSSHETNVTLLAARLSTNRLFRVFCLGLNITDGPINIYAKIASAVVPELGAPTAITVDVLKMLCKSLGL